MDPVQLKAHVESIFADLERYSYYELLGLTPESSPDEVRTAFHRMALSLHPDRYQQHSDADLREMVYAVYKRITEGYRVLMNDRARQDYDRGLAAGQLRLTATERRRPGAAAQPEEQIPHPQARKFFLLGLDAERRGDLKGARLNYRLAANLAGELPVIAERLNATSVGKASS